MIQASRYFLTELERNILLVIGEAGAISVRQVHDKLKNFDFIGVMRETHKLYRKGYLSQTHVGGEAQYKVKPRILSELKKTVL